MFAHSPALTAEAVAATAGCGRPRWAKLSPNVTDLTEIAGAALEAGAEALTLVNTVMGMAIDVETRRPRLGAGGGGLSGPAIRPVAVRAVLRRAARRSPTPPSSASAAWPPASTRWSCCWPAPRRCRWARRPSPTPGRRPGSLAELERWCRRHGVARVADLVGRARADT